jgi:hypothetical protein
MLATGVSRKNAALITIIVTTGLGLRAEQAKIEG